MFFRVFAGFQADHLGRPRFSSNFDTRQSRAEAGAPRFVYDASKGVTDELQVLRTDGKLTRNLRRKGLQNGPVALLDSTNKGRPEEGPPVGDGRCENGNLNRSDQ